MRGKVYRPFKLWIVLFLINIFGTIGYLFINETDDWKKYIILFCVTVLWCGLILCFTFNFKVDEDKITIKHGLSSFGNKYRAAFFAKTLLIDDINSIDVRDSGKTVIFSLKNGDDICFNIGGYFNQHEIIQLFFDVKKQLDR